MKYKELKIPVCIQGEMYIIIAHGSSSSYEEIQRLAKSLGGDITSMFKFEYLTKHYKEMFVKHMNTYGIYMVEEVGDEIKDERELKICEKTEGLNNTVLKINGKFRKKWSVFLSDKNPSSSELDTGYRQLAMSVLTNFIIIRKA